MRYRNPMLHMGELANEEQQARLEAPYRYKVVEAAMEVWKLEQHLRPAPGLLEKVRERLDAACSALETVKTR